MRNAGQQIFSHGLSCSGKRASRVDLAGVLGTHLQGTNEDKHGSIAEQVILPLITGLGFSVRDQAARTADLWAVYLSLVLQCGGSLRQP